MKPLTILSVTVLSLVCLRHAATEQLALTDVEQRRFEKLAEDLGSDDPQTLDLALQGLSAMGPKAVGALDRLTSMLADGRRLTYSTARSRSSRRTFQVNVTVVWVLRSIGPPAVPALVTALKNEGEQVRLPAIQSLCELGQPVALDVWLRALRDENKYVQIYAARALAESRHSAAVDGLCEALQDEDMEVRIEVAQTLGQIGDHKAIGPLIGALPVGKANISLESAVSTALARMGAPAVTILLEKIDTFDENRRRMVNVAIRRVDAEGCRLVLRECLRNKHWQVREAALEALANLRTPESLCVVTNSVEDPQWNVRWTAARLLGGLADAKSAGAIRPILLAMVEHDADPRVREKSLSTLSCFPGIPTDDYWETLETALHDESPGVRAMAANSCGKFPHAQFASRLREMLNDPNGNVRAESAGAIGQANIRDAVPDLIRRLDDEDLQTALCAGVALGKLGTDKAIAGLIAKLRDTSADERRRNLALNGLCCTTNLSAIRPLRAALEDSSLRRYHLQVKNALKKFGED